jgi:hypothetical protein
LTPAVAVFTGETSDEALIIDMRLEVEDATATASLRISGTAATDFLERALEGGGTRTPLEHYRTTLERCMPELLGRVDRK